jgi:hypothetical protein
MSIMRHNNCSGGGDMTKLNRIKESIEKWVENSEHCEILSKKVIDSLDKKDLMSFNTIFSERERNIKYTVLGFENDAKECCVVLEVAIYTGMEEEINEEKQIKGYNIEIKNMGAGKEALVKLTKWIKENETVDFQEMMDIIVENGISKLVYQFSAWNF